MDRRGSAQRPTKDPPIEDVWGGRGGDRPSEIASSSISKLVLFGSRETSSSRWVTALNCYNYVIHGLSLRPSKRKVFLSSSSRWVTALNCYYYVIHGLNLRPSKRKVFLSACPARVIRFEMVFQTSARDPRSILLLVGSLMAIADVSAFLPLGGATPGRFLIANATSSRSEHGARIFAPRAFVRPVHTHSTTFPMKLSTS